MAAAADYSMNNINTNTNTNNTYDLFLSYNWENHSEVINIHRILSKQGLRVWLDLVEIKFGDHIQERIENAIKNSNAFICFISNEYIKSKNCEMEFYCACNENKKIYMILMEPLYKLSHNHNEKSFFMNKKDLLAQLNNEQISKDVLIQRNLSSSSFSSSASSSSSPTLSSSSSSSSSKVATQQQQQTESASNNKRTFLESMASKILQFFNLNFNFNNTTETADNNKPKRYNSYPSVQAYRA